MSKHLELLKRKAAKLLSEEADLPTHPSEAGNEVPDSLKEDDLPTHPSDAGKEIPDSLKEGEDEDKKEVAEEDDKEDEDKKEVAEEDDKDLKEEDDEDLKEEDEDKKEVAEEDDKFDFDLDEEDEDDLKEEDEDKKEVSEEDDKEDDLKEEEEDKKEVSEEDDKEDEKLFSEEDDADIAKSAEALTKEDKDAEKLPESFKRKAKPIFEATVKALVAKKVKAMKKKMLKAGNKELKRRTSIISEKLVGNVDNYLSYVSEEWLNENKIAIESGLKTELTERFISGLKNLFVEHYIDIPENKVNIVERLSDKVNKLTEQLNDEANKRIAVSKKLNEVEKAVIVEQACSNLSVESTSKLKKLCENITFSDVDDFIGKVKTIKEHYFPKKKATAKNDLDSEVLNEGGFEAPKVEKRSSDAFVAAAAAAISNSIK